MVLEKSAQGQDNAEVSEESQSAVESDEVSIERLQEETEEDAREFSEGPGAWSHYYLYTQDDGSISGHCGTNDDGDTGYPGQYAEWEVQYRDKESMLKHLSGGSHMGWTGVRVEVHLDGAMIGERLPELHEGI